MAKASIRDLRYHFEKVEAQLASRGHLDFCKRADAELPTPVRNDSIGDLGSALQEIQGGTETRVQIENH